MTVMTVMTENNSVSDAAFATNALVVN